MAEYPLLTELLDIANVSITHYQLVSQKADQPVSRVDHACGYLSGLWAGEH